MADLVTNTYGAGTHVTFTVKEVAMPNDLGGGNGTGGGSDGGGYVPSPDLIQPSKEDSFKEGSPISYKPVDYKIKNQTNMDDPTSINHYGALLKTLAGDIQYDTPNDILTPPDEYLPLHNQDVKLSEKTKNDMKKINVAMATAKARVLNEYGRYGDGNENAKKLGYDGVNDWLNEIQANVSKYVGGFSVSSMLAGVKCETIYNELVSNMNLTGLNKDVFINACRSDKVDELKRMKHAKAIPTNCCLLLSRYSDKYKGENEILSDYLGRVDLSPAFQSWIDSYFN